MRTRFTIAELTYINSYRSRLGGFFRVERNSSAVIFLLSRTSTFAVKIVKTIFDKFVSIKLVDFLGSTGVCVKDAPNPGKCDENIPPTDQDVAEGFSGYTHRTTSA